MQMHYCTCTINQAGQGVHIFNVLYTDPLSWPEVQLMMHMHNEENVYDIKPCSVAETDQISEKRRLMGKYVSKQPLIEQMFPGRNPGSMELMMPGDWPAVPPADEYGVPQKPQIDPDEDEEYGSDPPMGPAVMKQGPIAPPVKRSFAEP